MDKFNKFWGRYKGVLHILGWTALALISFGTWLGDVAAYGGQIKDLLEWKDVANERLARMDGNIEIIVRTLGQKPIPKERP